MTREDIIRMAREAKLSNEIGAFGYPYLPELERFAALVASAEREACAELADMAVDFWVKGGFPECAEVREAMNISEAIRARGQA